MALGRMALGRMALGRMALGRMALGRMALGRRDSYPAAAIRPQLSGHGADGAAGQATGPGRGTES